MSEGDAQTKYRITKPDHKPFIRSAVVDCPCCGAPVEYEVLDDDCGAWGPQEDWPICEPCGVLIDVPCFILVEKKPDRF